MVVFFDLLGGISRNSNKIIRALGSGEIGFAKGFDEETEEEFDNGTKDAKTGVFEVAVVGLPVILSGNMAITDVGGVGLVGKENLVLPLRGGGAVGAGLRADGFGLGASDRDDKIIMAEVEMGKISLTQGAEDATESGWEEIEPAGFDRGILEPVDALWAILRGIDGGVRIEVVEFEEDFFGAALLGEPIAD